MNAFSREQQQRDAAAGEHRSAEGEHSGLCVELSNGQKQETCFVFDWDDTILPTSWLERIQGFTGGASLRPEVQRQIAGLCSAVVQTLNLALSMGRVILITNSAPGWVDHSCTIFMPQIHPLIRGFKCCAKPPSVPLTFKNTAFRKECGQIKNLISVGDGESERTASLRLHANPERKFAPGGEDRQIIKSLKLVELPTCQQLIVQHEMLQQRLQDIALYQGSLDLKARFPPASGPMGSPSGGKPTFVHFTRLPGAAAGVHANAPLSPMSPHSNRPFPAEDASKIGGSLLSGGVNTPRAPLPPVGTRGGMTPMSQLPLPVLGASTVGEKPTALQIGKDGSSADKEDRLHRQGTTGANTAGGSGEGNNQKSSTGEPAGSPSGGAAGSPLLAADGKPWRAQGLVSPGKEVREVSLFTVSKKRPPLASLTGVGTLGQNTNSVS